MPSRSRREQEKNRDRERASARSDVRSVYQDPKKSKKIVVTYR